MLTCGLIADTQRQINYIFKVSDDAQNLSVYVDSVEQDAHVDRVKIVGQDNIVVDSSVLE